MSEATGEVKKLPKEPGMVTCRFCDGTGKYLNKPCEICGGKGEVEVVDKNRKCQFCKGRGYMMAGIPCTTCGGTGATRPLNKLRLF
jgi:RecJ-like exonuclease